MVLWRVLVDRQPLRYANVFNDNLCDPHRRPKTHCLKLGPVATFGPSAGKYQVTGPTCRTLDSIILLKNENIYIKNCISSCIHTTELSSVAGEMDWRVAKEERAEKGKSLRSWTVEPAQRRKEPGLAIARSSVSIYPHHSTFFNKKKPHHSSPIVIVHPIFIRWASCLPA